MIKQSRRQSGSSRTRFATRVFVGQRMLKPMSNAEFGIFRSMGSVNLSQISISLTWNHRSRTAPSRHYVPSHLSLAEQQRRRSWRIRLPLAVRVFRLEAENMLKFVAQRCSSGLMGNSSNCSDDVLSYIGQSPLIPRPSVFYAKAVLTRADETGILARACTFQS